MQRANDVEKKTAKTGEGSWAFNRFSSSKTVKFSSTFLKIQRDVFAEDRFSAEVVGRKCCSVKLGRSQQRVRRSDGKI